VDILYPNLCLACGRWFPPPIGEDIVILCNRCEKLLHLKNQDTSAICYICGREIKKHFHSSISTEEEIIYSQQEMVADNSYYDTPQFYQPKSINSCSQSGATVLKTYDGSRRMCALCADDFSKKNPPAFKAARTAIDYNETARYLIHRLKYSISPHIGEYLAGYLVKAFSEFKEAQDIDYVIPVPLYWLRQLKRGYNQSEILSSVFARRIGKKCLTNILIRRKPTPHQARLTRNKRLENTKDVFTVRSAYLISGKNILLIDDVMTTGATFNGCASALIKAGALSVYCLALTRNEKGG